MATKEIIIDGYIGNYGYSKQYIRNELSGNSKNAVLVKISSLGGSVDDALNIFDQFVDHGNVTAELSAFVASSATIISLGAKTVRMNENSFYLIHKVMNWVDEWGTMNEDAIEVLINKLEKQKQELAKVTLQIAKMYVKKTGKTLEEITALMKDETWLTAEEAQEWGFIDDVFALDVPQNYLENLQMVAMVTGNGLPALPRKNATQQPAQNSQIDEESFFERIWNRITKKQEDDINNNSQKIVKMKKFAKLNTALGVDSLESVDKAVSLNEEQLERVEGVLSDNEQAVADARTAVETERDTANAERDTAQTDLTNAVEAFDGIDQTVAAAKTPAQKAEAIRTLLAAKPGAAPKGNLDNDDPSGGSNTEEDWDTINNLPHNKEVDKNS
jgi:ATP-dependent Clp protease, protease subunit